MKREITINEEVAVERILRVLGEGDEREGIADTPKRFINFMEQFCNPEPFNFTTFDSEGHDEIVIVKDIQFYSLCEHHLAPFFGTAAIAYIPNGKIVGLSKMPRVLEMFARRLQNQERITNQVAEYLMEHLNPKGVAVVLNARHMCMEMRGIKKPGANTITSAMRGVFKENLNTRQEFLNLIK
ncbi:MAG TPA: GTP cyclohydrolase I FolE [Candidatus Babeliaceae bacterium]|nr:GTP cyclohydrolase I FolE [Candidatus Babeliaceae bacterium]